MLIDAENVRRSRWPNVPAGHLVELCAEWGRREQAHVVVVFDGSAPEEGGSGRDLDPRCRVVGTGGESADAWIVRRAGQLERTGEPFWLVTSDRAVRAAAGRAAARTIGGGSFLRELDP